MQSAIDHACGRSGVTVIQLAVTQGNAPATALYRSLGFQDSGIEPMALLTPGGYRVKAHMWRPLGSASHAA